MLAGVSEGTNKSGNGGLGYLFTFIRVLFEFLTFWRQGDDMLRQSGRGFKAGKKVISKRFAQPSILPRACVVVMSLISAFQAQPCFISAALNSSYVSLPSLSRSCALMRASAICLAILSS